MPPASSSARMRRWQLDADSLTSSPSSCALLRLSCCNRRKSLRSMASSCNVIAQIGVFLERNAKLSVRSRGFASTFRRNAALLDHPFFGRRQMRIGVPREIKNHEYRVGLTPESVSELTHQ